MSNLQRNVADLNHATAGQEWSKADLPEQLGQITKEKSRPERTRPQLLGT
jgi:hypothetical protein